MKRKWRRKAGERRERERGSGMKWDEDENH
jgi:hypothetical protein